MPKQSHDYAIGRLLEILKRLPRRGPGVSTREITQWLQNEGYEVSKRTVERDLGDLARHFQVYCNDKSIPYGWHWLDKEGPDLPSLTVADALSLSLVEDLLRPLLPAAMLDSLEPRFRQAQRKLAGLAETNPRARWLDKVRYVPPALPLLAPKIPNGVLEAVQNALLADRQIEAAYQRPDAEEPQTLRLHPLGLVQRGPVTYLVATVFDYADIRLLAVHRIREAREIDALANRPEAFSLDDYINHGALNFGGGEFIELQLAVSDYLAKMLAETPLSEDMKVVEQDGGFLVTATVIDSWQLQWWILAWGDEIEVLAPLALRQAIIERLERASAGYKPSAGKN